MTRKTGPARVRHPARAHRHALYQDSVQDAEHEADFLARAYVGAFAREPVDLREDFCGTAAVCAAWVRLGRAYRALGVDLDPEPLAWGTEHNLGPLEDGQRARVTLHRGDVREVMPAHRADVVAAQNYSYWTFRTRDELRAYFAAAHANLRDRGVLVLDMMGGPRFMEEDARQERPRRGYTYVWEQERFDPVTHDCVFHITFRFPDGTHKRRAFTYRWRMWTLPEVRELLVEAGFARAVVYFGQTDPDTGTSTGEFIPATSAPADPAWLAYVVGIKEG